MVATATTVWDSVLSALKSEISYSSFETWFQETRPVALGDGSLTISVPDPFTKGGIERRYREMIEEIASESCDHPVALVIEIVNNEPNGTQSPVYADTPAGSQQSGALPLNSDYTFASFIRGKNCDLAYFASEAVAGKLGTAYNPLFIYGNVGLGKTHLLQAITSTSSPPAAPSSTLHPNGSRSN
jgi:chromosomal replication initiator protein